MMELWIDGVRCDLTKEPSIPLNFDIQQLSKVEGERAGRTIEVELPLTAQTGRYSAIRKTSTPPRASMRSTTPPR